VIRAGGSEGKAWGKAGRMSARRLRIINEKGLHARASAKFVEVVEDHDAQAQVSKDGMTVSGDSIMGLLMLGASRGTEIEVATQGAEAEKLADALEALVANRFGEDY
jgi:phosphocarrier protein